MTLSVAEGIGDRAAWDGYVLGAPGASLYHLSGWKDVVEEAFGHPTTYLSAVARETGRLRGVFPLVQLKSRLFGNMFVSLPFFNYGGICAEGEAERAALLEGGIRAAREAGADFLEIREEGDVIPGLPKKTSKVSMRLPLPADAETLWGTFPSKLRSQVQRARKAGLEAVVGREEALDGFYDVFSENMRDLGTPVYPKSFFRSILRRFPERTWISTVLRGGVPVASGFLAGFRERLEIPWASSLRAHNPLSPNMLLYWRCLQFACESGYGVFDFGRSTPGEGTYRFKEQWGATPHPMYWFYWLPRGGELPQVNPKNPRYRAAIRAWRRVPLPVTRILGPRIVKYLP